MKYRYPVSVSCGVLEVSASGVSMTLEYAIVDDNTILLYANEQMGISEDSYMDWERTSYYLYLTVDGETQEFSPAP